MKKTVILLLALLLCMSVCFPVFADMGGPEFLGYTATVKSDVPYYDWVWDEATDESSFEKEGTIPAGTVLKIDNEYEMDGEMFAYFFNAEALDGADGYVRALDLSVYGHEDSSTVTAYKQKNPVRLRVTDPKGVTLYAGPSASYGKVGTIPKGAEVTVDTLDQDGFDVGAWMYLTYGGKSGWTRCWLYEGSDCPMAELLPKGETGTIWVVKDNAVLKDRASGESVTVPKGEKLTFDSFNRSPHAISYYVTYAGKTGPFTVDDDGYDNVVASDRNDAIVYSPSANQLYITGLYEYPDDKIPTGTVRYRVGDKLESEFLYYAEPENDLRGGVEWYYVEKDGQSGWLKTDRGTFEYPEDWSAYERDMPELGSSGMESTAKKIEVTVEPPTTEAETALTQIDDSMTEQDVSQTAQADGSTAAEEAETTEAAVETLAAQNGRPPLSPMGIIGVCIAAAAVLALTAFVTLRLIRRKKQSH